MKRYQRDTRFLAATALFCISGCIIAWHIVDTNETSPLIHVSAGIVGPVQEVSPDTSSTQVASLEEDQQSVSEEISGAEPTLHPTGPSAARCIVELQNLVDTSSLDPAALLELGRLLLKENRGEEAIAPLLQSLSQLPSDSSAWFHLGLAYTASGHLPKAMAAYQKTVQLHPQHSQAYYNMGLIQLRSDNDDAAEISFRQASFLGDNNLAAKAYFQLGALAAQDDSRTPEAIADYRKALALQPDYAQARNNLSLLLDAAGDGESAIHELEKAVALNPSLPSAQFNLGRLYSEDEKYEAAVRCLAQAVELDPQMAKAHYYLGLVYERMGEPIKALDAYRKTIAVEPSQKRAALRSAMILRDTNSMEAAEIAFQEVVRLDPTNASAWNSFGILYARWNQPAKALDCYDHAVQLDPANVEALFNRALAFESLNSTQAIVGFREVWIQSPSHLAAREHYAKALAKDGQIDQALKAAADLEHLAGGDSSALGACGYVYLKCSRPDLASKVLERAIKLEPQNYVTSFNLGLAYSRMDMKNEAIEMFQDALACRPDFDKAKEGLARLIDQKGAPVAPLLDNP